MVDVTDAVLRHEPSRPSDYVEGGPQDASKSLERTPLYAPKSAVEILTEGAHCIGDRASERDTESERSMARTVKAFNAMFNKDLTETEGWQFMELLKMSRSVGGKFREDDFVDGAAYAALAGECAATSGRTS